MGSQAVRIALQYLGVPYVWGGANPLTVAKAYQGFQDEGLVLVRRGVGMFVAPGARAKLRDAERSRFVKQEWPAIRERMQRLGLDPAELMRTERA